MNITIGISVFLYILYWWLLSFLGDVILEFPRIKKNYWLIIGTFNAVIVFYAFKAWNNLLLIYLMMTILIFIEVAAFYKNRFSRYLLFTLACSIHIIAIFMITLGCISIITGYSSYEILNSESLLIMSIIIGFIVLDFAILGVAKLVPLLKVRMISQYKEQRRFIITWMIVNNVFLFYMANAFSNPIYSGDTSVNQMACAIASIFGLYIVLFFSIKTSTILGYKEKSRSLEQAIQQEKQYRNSMLKDALAAYEINITKDLIIKGFEENHDGMEDIAYSYTDMLDHVAKNLIYSEDIPKFKENYSRENIIKLFESGESEMTTVYRRLLDNENYVWVRAIINLVEDIESREIMAFGSIKNIDTEKKDQLELKRLAERDPLTGLYNKAITAKLIEDHVNTTQSTVPSALFMIDVDEFKDINDHFGHVYGDAVLCELSDKLIQVFRSDDVVGRIGGDEFMVFLKDGAVPHLAEEKAEKICKAFQITYKGQEGEEYKISSSIGIAFFPKDGKTFNDLYKHADIALYEAKNSGKNTYKIYDGCHFTGYTSRRTEIQPVGNILQKGFRNNRIEYVFKMLYQSDNPSTAIRSALELVASHFSFERGYIFETSKDGKTTSNTFEWCAEGVSPEIKNLQNIPIEAVETANSNFYKNGTFILKSLDDLDPVERDVLEPQGIKSMFQFGIFDKNYLLGFIGFDNCRSESVPSDTVIDEMKTICNILSTFFVKQHMDEAATKDLFARQEVMNHLDSYIYVIHTETFEILFMNDKIQKLMKQSPNEKTCYRFFRGNSEQCPDCPLRQLGEEKLERTVCEIFNKKLNIWMEATASILRWTDGNLGCLISCTDITKQKEANLRHISQLENLVYIDVLTGCNTYHKFKENALAILKEEEDLTHLLIKLDIDNFKLINQIYGYEKGDEILCYVAKALEKTTRNKNEVFARITNDEFIALFTIYDASDIEKLYQTFLEEFYALVEKDFGFKCNFPHGYHIVYPNRTKNKDINDLFEKVNFAHKAAKLDRTLEHALYDESMTKEALHVKSVENRMEDALKNNEFIVYLQPKFYLDNEKIGGAEALTRWENENMDLFFPNTFIPIFEKNKFIVKLDIYIFKKVCGIIKEWIESGIEPIVVSVNFSRLHLRNPNFVKELEEIADSIGVEKSYLEIEITETAIYDHIDTLEVLINELHRSGFTMSIDDFGSGYSSLGMLKNLPVDVIKIDRSFFVNQQHIERSKIVIKSVIQMAKRLGICTIAEGVEDQEHIDFLRELNCNMVQGYYYAKPMDTKEFTKRIQEQKMMDRENNSLL